MTGISDFSAEVVGVDLGLVHVAAPSRGVSGGEDTAETFIKSRFSHDSVLLRVVS